VLGPLLTASDILSGTGVARQDYDAPAIDMLMQAAHYVSKFLTMPHPALGRPGAICPFAGEALRRNAVLLTASYLHTPDKITLVEAVLALQAVFPDDAAKAADDIYRAIVIVFPCLPPEIAPSLIERVQKELKSSFIRRGLMIGEFYPGCRSPGLHNPDFQPLNTTFCSLAIRRMAPADAPFMLNDESHISDYLKMFGSEGRRRLSDLIAHPERIAGQAATIRRLLATVAGSNLTLASTDPLRGETAPLR
jgi:hypothetical protein